MSYHIEFADRADHLRVEVSGHRTPGREVEDAVAVWSEVADRCRAASLPRILAVMKLSGRLPTMAAFDIAHAPDSFGWSREFQLALVDLNEESRKDNLFTETIAVNRGFRVKVFDNEDDARAWLLGS